MPILLHDDSNIERSPALDSDYKSVSSLTTLNHFHTLSLTLNRGECIPQNRNVIWQIERGAVRTSAFYEDGSLISLGFWGAGDIVGYRLSQLDFYRIECLAPTTLLGLSELSLRNSYHAMLSHIQQVEELLRIMHCSSCEERLLSFLAWLGRKFGRKTNLGWLIEIQLTHQDIADAIGTTRVTVTRMLNKLRQNGMISCPRQGHIVLESL